MAKSGLASVELLASKGAIVRACDTKPLDRAAGGGGALARAGVPFQPQSWEAIAGRGLDRRFSRRARRSRPVASERAAAEPGSSAKSNWPAASCRARRSASPDRTGRPRTTALIGHILHAVRDSRAGGRQHRHCPGHGHGGHLAARTSGMCWSCPASNWKPSKASAPGSASRSTSRRITWTGTTPSRPTRRPRRGSSIPSSPMTSRS